MRADFLAHFRKVAGSEENTSESQGEKMKTTMTGFAHLTAAALALCTVIAIPGSARAGITYGKEIPALQVGQSFVYAASSEQKDIDVLQLVFFFSAPVGGVYEIVSMPNDFSKPED